MRIPSFGTSSEMGGKSTLVDVQTQPAAISDPKKAAHPVLLKVDSVHRVGSLLVAVGWSTGNVSPRLRAGGQLLETRSIAVQRPDVQSHFSLPSGVVPGFVLIAKGATGDVALVWESDRLSGESLPLRLDDYAVNPPNPSVLGPAWAALALEETPFTPTWRELVARVPATLEPTRRARAYVDALLHREGGGAVVGGWVVQQPDVVVWLEDESGIAYPLDRAFRQYRQDVYDAVKEEFPASASQAAFVAYLPEVRPGTRLTIKVLTPAGVHVLSERDSNVVLPSTSPVAAAQPLLFLGTRIEDLSRRIPLVDEPVLSSIIELAEQQAANVPVERHEIGPARESVEISIIVPLYGRRDFVEHQLLEFARDPWLKEHAEVLYVLDDPRLKEGFRGLAADLFGLYRVPFSWLWGGVNRGFSGANNLGAKGARGKKLVFLNSDAFPKAPGWLEALTRVLDERPDVGAVAPRLLFADGSIQHAGMAFHWRDDLGIWVNHHPGMGLDPALDPHKELSLVPAVTGACLAVRQSDFQRVGGWDTGYLIGDFEDSDLCLKLRKSGLASAYLPTVELTHLERQSFKLLGQDEFRTRVTIYNAVRHQTRWKAELEALGARSS